MFEAQNLNGQPVEVKGTYSLYPAKDKDYKQLGEKPVATGTFTSNKEMTFNWGKFSSGPYVLKATVKDNQGKEVTAEQIRFFSLLTTTSACSVRRVVLCREYGI